MCNPDLIKPILSEHEAAAFLNVSTPFLVKQLENGKLQHFKVGCHRRVASEKLLEFKQSMHRDSEEALHDLVTQAQELGFGY
jgi:excisionase family DNA binding protein